MAQYEHILINPPEDFCGPIYHCVLATLINSSEQTQYLLLLLFQLTRKICGTIFLMYHIVLQPHRNICVCNMYMCSSLPISSIEIQLYGSVGLGQFIVHGYLRQDKKSSSVGIRYHQELWRIAYRQEIHLLICCQSESNFSKKYSKKYSNYFSCSKMFAP